MEVVKAVQDFKTKRGGMSEVELVALRQEMDDAILRFMVLNKWVFPVEPTPIAKLTMYHEKDQFQTLLRYARGLDDGERKRHDDTYSRNHQTMEGIKTRS